MTVSEEDQKEELKRHEINSDVVFSTVSNTSGLGEMNSVINSSVNNEGDDIDTRTISSNVSLLPKQQIVANSTASGGFRKGSLMFSLQDRLRNKIKSVQEDHKNGSIKDVGHGDCFVIGSLAKN